MTAAEVNAAQKLMVEFVNEMIASGTESPKLDAMIRENHANTEFLRLAGIARRMKRSFAASAGAGRDRSSSAEW